MFCGATNKKTGDLCNRRATRLNKQDTPVCGFHVNTDFVVQENLCPDPCPICLEPIQINNSHLTACFHCFHDKCLALWSRDTCPICRENLKTKHKELQLIHLVAKSETDSPAQQLALHTLRRFYS